MKLTVFKSAAFGVLMTAAFASCTNEVIEIQGNKNSLTLGQGEDVIRIRLSNTTATRAARPMGSSEPDNNVNRLAFRFMTSSQDIIDYVAIECVVDENSLDKDDEFKVDTEDNVLILPEGYDGSEICVKFSGLQEGAYKIIAYGYNYTEGTDAADAFPYNPIKQKAGSYLLQCEGVSEVQEIFAGCNEGSEFVSVNQHGKFSEPPVIRLQRQVAGLMAYFMNAPVFVSNRKVAKITVSSKSDVTGFYFPAVLIPDNPEYNGMQTSGWNEKGWVDYLTFDMKKASNYSSRYLVSGDYYEFDNEDGKYLLANETAPIEGLVCNGNTLFGSRFLLAYPSPYDCNVNEPKCATLNICYWAEDNSLILSVPLRSGGDEKPLDSSADYQYHILCNNFYSIGSKDALGGDPGDNEPLDIDEPTGYDYAKVSISDNWAHSHSLFN